MWYGQHNTNLQMNNVNHDIPNRNKTSETEIFLSMDMGISQRLEQTEGKKRDCHFQGTGGTENFSTGQENYPSNSAARITV